MSFSCKLILLAVILITFGPAFPGPKLHADAIVAPNSLSTTEGNLQNAAPFYSSGAVQTSPTARYQQVYNASEFTSSGGPLLITQLAFRLDSTQGGAFTQAIDDIQINLSTTSAVADNLSLTFANNVGLDDSVVYDGELTLSSADNMASAGNAREFDIFVNLQNPFLYNPLLGSLLLDVRNLSMQPNPDLFDAAFINGDAISRVGTYTIGDVNSATADSADTLGLVTKFTFNSVPEPSAMLIFGIGTASLALSRRRVSRR